MPDTGDAFVLKARSLLKSDYLPKIESCLERLSDKEIWWRPHPGSNSIGNLLLHVSGNARQWIVSGVGGASDSRERQPEFDGGGKLSREELLATLRRTLDDVDAVLSGLPSSRLAERRVIQDYEVTVLDAIFHVVEHFSMHTGQVIYITKQLTATDLHFYDL